MMILARVNRGLPCWLCGRPLGARIEWHHPVPKSRGGRETVAVHPLCHRTIHATFTNAQLARDFAAALAEAGFAVVSGLARGIDGAAHEGALPHTIGVIASGIDIAYPPQHADLQERIASEGLLLAEQPPGTEPRGSHFPSRNRIIAGLAAGTLVVEAAVRSNTLRPSMYTYASLLAAPKSSHKCSRWSKSAGILNRVRYHPTP